jgi:hypothetical protein
VIDYLTGADSRMFAQALILIQSLEEAGAHGLVRVCDFGLDAGQRRFLESRGQLAFADPPLPSRFHHAWYHKATIVDCARPDAETVMWIDADMMLMADPRPHVDALVSAMRRDGCRVAAAPDCTPSIGDYILTARAKGYDVDPFVQRLAEYGISQEHPYLNAGLYVADSREVMDTYKRLTFETREHAMWEQNAFNVAAWRDPRQVVTLDRGVWNLFNADLKEASLAGDGRGILCRGLQVLVVHVAGDFCEPIMKTIDVRGCRFSSRLRAHTEPHLREFQIGLFERFVTENQDALVEML